MVNKNKIKGSLAERGVRDYINIRYPLSQQGFGATIIPSQGSVDIGDIDGIPFTMIEVKNYRNPVWGNLVSNAEWKFFNSQRDFWVMVSKRHGFSSARAGYWDAVTTVSGLDSFGLRRNSQGQTLSEFLLLDNHPAEDVFNFSGFSHDYLSLQGDNSVVIKVFSCYSGIGDIAHNALDPAVNEDRLTLCVFPRKLKNVDNYYVFTNLVFYVKMLEIVGVVPKIPTSTELL